LFRRRYIVSVLLWALLAAGAPAGLPACGSRSKAEVEEPDDSDVFGDDEGFGDDEDDGQAGGADELYLAALDAEADENDEEAERLYRKALSSDPQHPRANQHYVYFLIDHGEARKALKVARRFFEGQAGVAMAYHLLADAQEANGDYEKVIGTMSGLLAFAEEDAVGYEKRGRARMRTGESEDGLRDLRRAVKIDGKNPAFLTSLAGGLLVAGRGDEARKVLQRALEEDDDHVNAHVLMGIIERSRRNNKAALAHHRRAVRIAPEDARANFELGVSLNILGKNQEAEERLGRAVELDPDNGNYWYVYGDLLRLMKRREESAAAYRQSVRADAGNARAWNRLGEMLIETDQLSNAAKMLRRGIAKTDDPHLYFVLARVYARAKKRGRAVEALENYLDAADPSDPDRKQARRMLRKLRR
jgi:tetratricopeptide (TPR) repeat protein